MPSAPTGEIASYFADNRGSFIADVYLFGLSMIAATWFLAIVWRRLREAEGEPAVLSTIALLGGFGAIAVTLAASGFHLVLAIELEDRLDPELVRLLFELGNSTLGFAVFPLAVFFGAVAIIALRTGMLPRWMGLAAAALALAQPVAGLALFVQEGFFAPGGAFGGILLVGLLVWTVSLVIVLLRGERAGVPASAGVSGSERASARRSA